MVGVSTKSLYGVAAMHALYNSPRNKLMQIKEIAAMTQISHGYLEQILSNLKKHGFVVSIRGANGGYKLARDASNIIVLDIIEALEGELFAVGQNVGASVVLDSFWKDIQEKVRAVFHVKLSELDKAYATYFYEI
ncbi:Rrf2 family transcriptional regulator [Sulfurimonas sediminis]|uniref:Rrf2 family transcriptional regulator n=1 Tax=Sulfurimonas sediminis TaxID=2590020 RepID=A0A7M1B5V5_9BACT|nr:Rrf2 family transcriptional regulator [Sulfurimonas sediminis]QOP44138.1 Rrf2 family transcriptional regulator [Sulfurimonas sediminis]